MRLAELQRHLARAASGMPADPALLAGLAPGPSRERRLAVYSGTVREVHLRALASAFPVCVEVLGMDYWRQLMTRLAAPFRAPRSDLNRYGGHVPALLAHAVATRPELADFEYLPDLSLLEWRVQRARFAADEPAFDLGRLAAVPAHRRGDVRLRLHRAAFPGRSDWPVDGLWRAHRAGGQAVGAGPARYIVHRCRGFEPAVDGVEGAMYDLLTAVGAGRTLAALEATGGHDAADLLHAIQRGWIVGDPGR